MTVCWHFLRNMPVADPTLRIKLEASILNAHETVLPRIKFTLTPSRVSEQFKGMLADSKGSSKVLRGVIKEGEFRNWSASVQTAPAKLLKPQTLRDVQGILAQVTTY